MKPKRILTYLLIALLFVSINVISNNGYTVHASSSIQTVVGDTISTRAEKTEWRYRFVDGKMQKRLWSITHLKWLTDWEWV